MLDLPPSYDITQPQPAPQLQHDQESQPSEDLPILVIDDCRIYSAYAPTRTLYQLSNPVADANRTVYGIEKFRYRVDDTSTESKLKHVEDHIYDISREVQLRALPTIHIKGFTSSKRTYKSVNIVDATKVGGGYKVEQDNADKDELLRTERPFKDLLNQGRGNTVEWKDASGQVIAVETKLQRDDNKNIVEPPRLAIKASINDKLYDLLVTSWCAVIWREAKHDLKEPFTWQKFKDRTRNLQRKAPGIWHGYDCNISGNYTIIDSPDGQDGISSCKDVDGSLSLLFDKSPTSWPIDKATVDLGTVSSLTGSLDIYPHHHSKKTTVTASSLKSIDGEFTIWNTGTGKDSTVEELDLLFDALEQVGKGYVITSAFAKLSIQHKKDVEVGGMMRVTETEVEGLVLNGIHTVNDDFMIDSNSDMKELDVPALTYANKGFSVKGNNALTKASFPKLKEVKGNLEFNQNGALTKIRLAALENAATMSITANGKEAHLLLPYLSSIGNSTTSATSNFKGIDKIEFSSLREVKGALTFSSNYFDDLMIPLLKEMDGGITVEDNPYVQTFALPRVTYVDELTIDGNDKLTNITANALKSAGTISIKGSMTNVEFFNLEKVTGDFKVVGDKSMDCSWFDANVKKIVKGKYTCVGDHEEKERKSSTGGIEDTEGNPKDYMSPEDEDDSDGSGNSSSGGSGNGGSSGTGGSNDDKAGSGGMSTGAKAGLGIGIAILVVLIIVGAVMFWLWRRRRAVSQPKDNPNFDKQPDLTGLDPPRLGSSGGTSTFSSIFDGRQKMGVHTRIVATNPLPSPSPSLGTLNFGRTSLIESSGTFTEKSLAAWKTIRRVSDSSGASSPFGKEGTVPAKGV
ncbi:hypothetical protein ACHAPZ_009093 [Fusarium culmorum]